MDEGLDQRFGRLSAPGRIGSDHEP
jgi:hypothetical protein